MTGGHRIRSVSPMTRHPATQTESTLGTTALLEHPKIAPDAVAPAPAPAAVAPAPAPAPAAVAPARAPTVPPRWARRAATLIVLTTVPSGLWRVAMAVGVPVGVDDAYRRANYGFPGRGTAYVFGLTLLLVSLALLGTGLVRRWGEVTPRWIPLVGGRRVPPLAAIIPAGVGAAALTLLWTTVFLGAGEIFDVYGLTGAARDVVVACYAPLLLWGPLLAALTVSYGRRTMPRRPTG